MLDIDLSSTLADEIWERTSARSALPARSHGNEALASATSREPTRRQYSRIRCRGRAAIACGDQVLGVYMIDVSPMSVGFFSPIQLFPLDGARIYHDRADAIEIEIRRCLRVDQDCYACGAEFPFGPMAPGQYREFLNALRS